MLHDERSAERLGAEGGVVSVSAPRVMPTLRSLMAATVRMGRGYNSGLMQQLARRGFVVEAQPGRWVATDAGIAWLRDGAAS